jgi:hypothetical protein
LKRDKTTRRVGLAENDYIVGYITRISRRQSDNTIFCCIFIQRCNALTPVLVVCRFLFGPEKTVHEEEESRNVVEVTGRLEMIDCNSSTPPECDHWRV